MIEISSVLMLGGALTLIGLVGLLLRKNLVIMLLSLELMLLLELNVAGLLRLLCAGR